MFGVVVANTQHKQRSYQNHNDDNDVHQHQEENANYQVISVESAPRAVIVIVLNVEPILWAA